MEFGNSRRYSRSNTGGDHSEISDGFISPTPTDGGDTESIASEIFGAPDSGVVSEDYYNYSNSSGSNRSSSRRLDSSKPITRRSISSELFNEQPHRPAVARRSISRELYDVQFTPSSRSSLRRESNYNYEPSSARLRVSNSRERSLGRELLDYDLPSSSIGSSSSSRNRSLSRGGTINVSNTTRSDSLTRPSRPTLTSQGRSLTQNEILLSPTSNYSTATSSSMGNGSRIAGRNDWRRISVPERGKDFKSLPRKYNRNDSSTASSSITSSKKSYH